MGNLVTNNIFLPDDTTDEMKTIVISFKNGATGCYNITPQMLKMIGQAINHALVHICNLSLQQGMFLKELNLPMSFPCSKQKIHQLSAITTQCIDCVYYQRFMKMLCIIV